MEALGVGLGNQVVIQLPCIIILFIAPPRSQVPPVLKSIFIFRTLIPNKNRAKALPSPQENKSNSTYQPSAQHLSQLLHTVIFFFLLLVQCSSAEYISRSQDIEFECSMSQWMSQTRQSYQILIQKTLVIGGHCTLQK